MDWCVWPGHPEWEAHEACVQIRSLALHYFTVRHPAVEAHRYEIAAQLLASQACPQGGDQHLDVEPRVQEALLWLWALAGGRRSQTHPRLLCPHSTTPTPRQSHSQEAILWPLRPQHWPCWKRCLRGHEAAHQTAATFLRTHADALARRALMLIDAIVQQETARVVEAGVICMDCGAEGLDVWYTGQTWVRPCVRRAMRHG